ncbi:hypothetical protein ACP70R_007372 [Stipagrostis hirtigluma subsp. patula]
MCSSMGTLNCADTTSSSTKLQQQQAPTSPTASVSESNIVISSTDPDTNDALAGLQALKFEGDIDGEIQSPDIALWESLFADQIGTSGADFLMFSPKRDFMATGSPRRDFMASSPKRDYMVSSPKRDYMISSPKRDYMVSSPKREYMVTSPRREVVSSPRRSTFSTLYSTGGSHGSHHQQGYVHGVEGGGAGHPLYGSAGLGKGKSMSPLHKVYSSGKSNGPSSLSCSSSYGHGENLSLPSMDPFLGDYKGAGGYLGYQLPGKPGMENVAASATTVSTAPSSSSSQLPTLSECLAMPEPAYGGAGEEAAVAGGLQMGGSLQHDMYYAAQFGGGGDGLSLQHHMAKSDQWAADTSVHSMLGSVIQAEADQEQDSGLQLVHLLLACADFVSKGDQPSALRHLHLLRRVASPLGDSMQRVASYFADALAARLSSTTSSSSSSSAGSALRGGAGGGAPYPFPPSPDTLKIYQILYQACPYVKFAHFTANQAIFEAFHGEDRVHVVDLDILQGYQWPAFLQALAARPGGPPTLRLTGVGHPAAAVRETGRHLASLAASLRVPFEFHAAVADRLERLRPAALQRRVGEALAVNAVNRLHRVPGAHLGPLLSMIRDQAPKIMTLVEQEAAHNGPYFLGRFLEALHYYSAIFDSLDATFPADSAPRMKVEQCLLAPEIRNVVACEGAERVARHERLDRWRRLMEGRGFEPVPLSPAAVGQSQVLLGLYGAGDGYRLTEDQGCLLLGWQDRAIIAASAWRC